MIKVLGFTILCGGWDATLKFSKRYDVFVEKFNFDRQIYNSKWDYNVLWKVRLWVETSFSLHSKVENLDLKSYWSNEFEIGWNYIYDIW